MIVICLFYHVYLRSWCGMDIFWTFPGSLQWIEYGKNSYDIFPCISHTYRKHISSYHVTLRFRSQSLCCLTIRFWWASQIPHFLWKFGFFLKFLFLKLSSFFSLDINMQQFWCMLSPFGSIFFPKNIALYSSEFV